MFTNFNSILRNISLIVITVNLVACGGGGDSLPPTDSSPPTIISTSPSSEAEGIRPGTGITVTFSEQISGAIKTNIDIYPVQSGVVNKNSPVYFELINSSNSFIILPNTELTPKAIYEVTITDVKDSSNNPMVKSCSWIFAIEGAPSIKTGKIGVCGSIGKIINLPENEIIIDTDDEGTSSVGNWPRHTTTPETYGVNGAHAIVGGEVNSFRFTPNLLQASTYEVYVWNSCYNNRSKNVSHIIQHANGIMTVKVDQGCKTGPHGVWDKLGTFSFNAGKSGYLEITDVGITPPSFTTYIGADAARFVRVGG